MTHVRKLPRDVSESHKGLRELSLCPLRRRAEWSRRSPDTR